MAVMKLLRRQFFHLVAGATALPALPRVASALDYPTRPVHIIVGFAPAGGTDIMARLIGQRLLERLDKQFTTSLGLLVPSVDDNAGRRTSTSLIVFAVLAAREEY